VKRTASHCTAFRWINIGFVLAACIGLGSLPAHAADLKPPADAGTLSTYTLDVINDTRARIDSFSMAPAGTDRWTKVDFTDPEMQASFDNGITATLQIHDDDGCLRDLRTVLSSGRQIFVRRFDLCHFDAYRVGVLFRNGHPGSRILPEPF
jgi:hypothetical protein